jgi:hypothetical protein
VLGAYNTMSNIGPRQYQYYGRHAIMKGVTHVGHENRVLISMTDMQFDWCTWCIWCVHLVLYGCFFFLSLSQIIEQFLETVLLFVFNDGGSRASNQNQEERDDVSWALNQSRNNLN